MGLFKRGSVYWYEFMFGGRRYRNSTHSSNKNEARDIENVFRTALIKGEVGITEKKVIPFFKEFMPRVEDEIKAATSDSESNVNHYQQIFKELKEKVPYIYNERLDKITAEHLAKYRQWLLNVKLLEAPTVNRRLSVLRRSLNLAYGWEIINRVPKFPMLSEKEHVREFVFTTALLEEFMAKVPSKYVPLFRLFLWTGLRRSELTDLTWDRVFLDDVGEDGFPYILIRRDRERKTRIKSVTSRREIPLMPEAVEIIKQQQKVSRSQFVFVQYGQRVKKDRHYVAPFEKTCVSKAFNRIKTKMKLPKDAVLHSTRHTILTELGRTLDVFTLQKIAGHADIRTTMRYVHPSREAAMEGFKKLAERREKQKEGLKPELRVVHNGGVKVLPTKVPTPAKRKFAVAGKS